MMIIFLIVIAIIFESFYSWTKYIVANLRHKSIETLDLSYMLSMRRTLEHQQIGVKHFIVISSLSCNCQEWFAHKTCKQIFLFFFVPYRL